MNENDDDAAVDVGRVRVEAVGENPNKELFHFATEPEAFSITINTIGFNFGVRPSIILLK